MLPSVAYAQTFSAPDWGSYYRPQVQNEAVGDPLRVVLFGSTLGGMWVLEGLKQLQKQFGANRIHIAGLATDDARIPNARISLKKRIWRHFPHETRIKMVNGIIENAINESIEVFTGNIKSAFFAELLQTWKPDVIIMACFGQLVPVSVFTYPRYGMYNYHPSDLKNGVGVGPKPFENTLENNMPHTCVSLMEVTEVIDHGPMVGYTPPICITGTHGEWFKDVLITEEKVTAIFPYMTEVLIKKLWQIKDTGEMPEHITIDMFSEICPEIQARMLEPVTGEHDKHYPFPVANAIKFPCLSHSVQS